MKSNRNNKSTTRLLIPIALLLALPTLAGCKDKSPEGVCDHIGKLGLAEDKVKESSWDKKRARCVEKLDELKDEIGDEGFAKWASCIHDQDNFRDAKGKSECNPKDFE